MGEILIGSGAFVVWCAALAVAVLLLVVFIVAYAFVVWCRSDRHGPD